MPSSASVVVVIVMVIPVPAGFNDAAGEQPTGEQQGDHRDVFDTHEFLSSISILQTEGRPTDGTDRGRGIAGAADPIGGEVTTAWPAKKFRIAFTSYE
jgi:hypothetical protein